MGMLALAKGTRILHPPFRVPRQRASEHPRACLGMRRARPAWAPTAPTLALPRPAGRRPAVSPGFGGIAATPGPTLEGRGPDATPGLPPMPRHPASACADRPSPRTRPWAPRASETLAAASASAATWPVPAPVAAWRLTPKRHRQCYDDKAALDMRFEPEAERFAVSTKKPRPLSCNFTFKGRSVRASLFYIEKMKRNSGEPPLAVESTLDFSFGAESDFSFVFDLAMVARDFLGF